MLAQSNALLAPDPSTAVQQAPKIGCAAQVLGTVKSTLVVFAGVLLFRDSVTPLQGAGYGVALAGGVLCNHAKMAGGALPLPPAVVAAAKVRVQSGGIGLCDIQSHVAGGAPLPLVVATSVACCLRCCCPG